MKTTLKKHLNLRLLFYVLSSCFTILTMFYPISCKKQKESASQQSVEIIRKEQERLKQSVQVRIQILHKRNDSLRYQLGQVNAQLRNQKALHLLKRAGIKQLIQGGGNDTLTASCDSIKQAVAEYVASDEHQDSLYQATIQTLQTIVQVKDSTVDVLQNALCDTQALTNQSLNRQSELEKNLAQKEKQIKRKQCVNRVLTTGVVILAGVTAILIIH
ncbi:MAG: hypothetical protein EWV91_07000 [Microcystis aeruginosa Ma_QC_Ca_00000000_S207]|uniref:Uncharacterized protein n=1 Tax=Microcystis aeruginosa Ma_QC_Ca_00000000_S207 TaxID=2486251 RepID=A0A552FSX0_MICAE|nr:MAG: hypothetical protein EWV91_07000 [Microcystis aeruginosa Ma_QC_Ca_00000000_S207]